MAPVNGWDIPKVWDHLDYTALVIPAGKVDRGVEIGKDSEVVSEYRPRNEADMFNWELYDSEALDGMPVSVQIAGRRLRGREDFGRG
jgi:hypothetical protein